MKPSLLERWMAKAPLMPAALFLIAGLLCGFAQQTATYPAWAIATLCALLASTVVLALLRRLWLAAAPAMVCVGWMLAARSNPVTLSEELTKSEYIYSGQVVRVRHSPESEGSESADILVDSVKQVADKKVDEAGMRAVMPFKVRLTIDSGTEMLTDTKRVRWTGALTPLADDTSWPLAADRTESLRKRGVTARCLIRPDALLDVSEEPGLLNNIRRYNAHLLDLLMDTRLSPATTGLLAALLLGDTSYVSADRRRLYSASGMAHLLALSGLHVGLVAMMASIVLAPLILMRRRDVLAAITVVLMWGYAVLTGLSPSVVRAVTMLTIFTGSFLLQRKPSPWNSLAAAAILILLVSPRSLLDIGFQLSFAAVIGIMMFAQPLNPMKKPRSRFDDAVWLVMSCLTVCIGAVLGTISLTMWHFHTLPVYFIFSVVGASVIAPVLVTGGALAIALQSVGLHSTLIDKVTDMSCDALNAVASWVASLPGATIEPLYPDALTMTLCLAAIISLAVFVNFTRDTKLRPLWGAATLLFILFTLLSISILRPAPDNRDRLLLTRDMHNATLLLRTGCSALIWTSAHLDDSLAVKSSVLRDYGDWLGRVGIREESVTMMPTRLERGEVCFDSNILSFHGLKIRMIGNDNGSDGDTPCVKADTQCDISVISPGLSRAAADTLRRIVPQCRAVVIAPGVNPHTAAAILRTGVTVPDAMQRLNLTSGR